MQAESETPPEGFDYAAAKSAADESRKVTITLEREAAEDFVSDSQFGAAAFAERLPAPSGFADPALRPPSDQLWFALEAALDAAFSKEEGSDG